MSYYLSWKDDRELRNNPFSLETRGHYIILRHGESSIEFHSNNIPQLQRVSEIVYRYGQGGLEGLHKPTPDQVEQWKSEDRDKKLLKDYGLDDLNDLERVIALRRQGGE